jgi:hypothetical protein
MLKGYDPQFQLIAENGGAFIHPRRGGTFAPRGFETASSGACAVQ